MLCDKNLPIVRKSFVPQRSVQENGYTFAHFFLLKEISREAAKRIPREVLTGYALTSQAYMMASPTG
jgi:hypothetical protein